MTKPIGWGLAIAMVCGLLAGCGGGGDGVDRSAHDQLQADLEAAQAELERIEAEEAAAAAKAAADAAAAKKAEEEAAAAKAEEAAKAARIKAAQDAAQKEVDDRIAKLTAAIAAIAAAQAETPEPEEEPEEEETPAATTAATTPATTPAATTTTATTPATTTTQTTTGTTATEQTVEDNERALGLMRALQVKDRAAISDTATTLITEGADFRTPKIINTPSGIRVTESRIGKATTGTASPSLRLGSTALRGTRLSRTEAAGFTEEVVIYTDFQGRRVKLLDYGGFGTGQVTGSVDPTDQRVINLDSSISPNILTRKLPYDDEKLMVQTSGITLKGQPADNILTAPAINTSTGDTILIDNDLTDATPAVSTQVNRRPRARSGVTLSHVTAGQSIVYQTTKRRDPDNNNAEVVVNPTPNSDIKVSFRGSLFGVNGTFSCTGGSDCTFQINPLQTSAGRYGPLSYTASTGWTFKPSSASTTIPVDDKEYLWFGWWQKTPVLADGKYEFRLLSGGVGYWETTDTLVAGTARYEGPAIGKWAKGRPLEAITFADLSDRVYEAGSFTAKAILDATFTGSELSAVDGTISDFQGAGTGDWLLRLQSPGSPTATGVNTGTILLEVNGKTPAESLTVDDWDFRFLKDHNTAAYTGAGGSQPRSGVGRFDVGLEDDLLHIAGVFGVIRGGGATGSQ